MSLRDEGPWSDDRIERIMGRLLQSGVMLAAVVVAAGGILYLLHESHVAPAFSTFRGEPETLSTIHGIVAGVMHLEPRAVIQLGILFLIGTPVARVVFSLVAFLLQRDLLYTVVTLIVLGTLLFSLFAGA